MQRSNNKFGYFGTVYDLELGWLSPFWVKRGENWISLFLIKKLVFFTLISLSLGILADRSKTKGTRDYETNS